MKLVAYILVLLGVSLNSSAHSAGDTYLALCFSDSENWKLQVVRSAETYDTTVKIKESGRTVFQKVIDYDLEEGGMSRELTFWSTKYINGEPDVSGRVTYPGSNSPHSAKGDVRFWDDSQNKFRKLSMICEKIF